MFEWITRYFPRRCQTEEAFIETVRSTQHSVEVFPHLVKPGTVSRAIGPVGVWTAYMRHRTTEKNGRVVIYDELFETWFGSAHGVGDAHEREERNRSQLKMCKLRAMRLLDELPGHRMLILPEHTGYQIVRSTCGTGALPLP